MPAWPPDRPTRRGCWAADRARHCHRGGEAGGGRALGLDRPDRQPRASPRSRPTRASWPTVPAAGRTLFGDNCAVCHGRDAKGGQGLPQPHHGRRGCGAVRPRRLPRPSASGINSAHPDSRSLPDARLRTRPRPRARRYRERRRLCAQPVGSRSQAQAGRQRSRPARSCSPRTARSATVPDAKGQDRGRCAQPDRPVLDAWRR